MRINAHEERDIRQRPRRHDSDGGASGHGSLVDVLGLPDNRGGDGLDGGTTVVDALPHRILVGGWKSLHAAEPVGAVDFRSVQSRTEEGRRCAAVHLDVCWRRERVQASRGVYLGILDSGVSVYLTNISSLVRVVRDMSYSGNAEKVYVGAMKCHQDGSGIVMSLGSPMMKKK